MGAPLVSLTHITMGKLLLRSMPPDALSELAVGTQQPPDMSHWTLRAPHGAMIIDLHSDRGAWQAHVDRSHAMFTDPVHRFSCEAYAFVDEVAQDAATATFARAVESVGDRGPSGDPSLGALRGRVVSFNRLPHLPEDVADRVRTATRSHSWASVAQLHLATPSGELLIDAYLAEDQLIDDFVFLHDLIEGEGHSVTNQWYAFTDRAHERALDWLAFGVGALAEPTD